MNPSSALMAASQAECFALHDQVMPAAQAGLCTAQHASSSHNWPTSWTWCTSGGLKPSISTSGLASGPAASGSTAVPAASSASGIAASPLTRMLGLRAMLPVLALLSIGLCWLSTLALLSTQCASSKGETGCKSEQYACRLKGFPGAYCTKLCRKACRQPWNQLW